MRAILLATMFVANSALAAVCPKVEYADVRDWPVENVQKAYCEATEDMYEAIHISTLGSLRQGNRMLAEADQCAEQVALFRRVLENVHKRKPADCPNIKPASK